MKECYQKYQQGAEVLARGCFSCKDLSSCAASSVADGPVQKQSVDLKFKSDAGTILDGMADTFRERNATYGDNYKMVGPMMKILFPKGVDPDLLGSDQFHLFELICVKLSRYAISGLTHKDSVHDAGVYCAMCEAININKEDEQ